tara:strand:- start:1539 stop:2222 length:684 start_codon:yes stop_codon:yes gene_type:complete
VANSVKRGMVGTKPKRKVPIKWSADVAYAVGLLVTDGCLLNDGRHIDLTSIDTEQLENFKKCLGIETKISYKTSGHSDNLYPRLQFSDVTLYKFLLSIGLTPAKTKTLTSIEIPKKYFFDFLRGHHDGDGTFYSYWDKRWRASFMFYTVFISSSHKHILWLRDELDKVLKVKGHISHDKRKSTYALKYAKRESLKILRKMYYDKKVVCLSRKRLKIEDALSTVDEKL